MKNQTEVIKNNSSNNNEQEVEPTSKGSHKETSIDPFKGHEPHSFIQNPNQHQNVQKQESDKPNALKSQIVKREIDQNFESESLKPEEKLIQDPVSFSKVLQDDIGTLRAECLSLKQIILPLECFHDLALGYRNESTGEHFSEDEITKDVMLHCLTKYIFQSVHMIQMTTDLRQKFLTQDEFKTYVLKTANNKEREEKDSEIFRQIKQSTERIADFETLQYALDVQMKQMQEDLRKTAQYDELLELSKKMDKLPTVTNLNVLENQFNYYLTLRNFEQFQENFDKKMIEVKEIGEQTVKKTDLQSFSIKIIEQLTNVENNSCKKIAQDEINEKFGESLQKLVQKNKKRKNETGIFKTTFSQIKQQIDQKASLNEFICLKDYINFLPTSENLESLRKLIFDAICDQKVSNEQYKKLFQDNCEIVERFDEVMTQKASKISLEELMLNIQMKQNQQMNEIEKRMNEAQNERNDYQSSFNNFSKVISEKIYDSVKKVMHNMPSPLSESDFNPTTLLRILSLKVDKTDFSKVYEEKADKVECENLVDGIRTLNKQIQHTIVLLNEQLMLNLTRGQDTEQAKNDRAIILLDQGRVLENWVMKFQVGAKTYDKTEAPTETASENIELNAAKQNLKLAIQDKHDWNVVAQGWRCGKQSRPKLLVSGPRLHQVPIENKSPNGRKTSKSVLKTQIDPSNGGTKSQLYIQSQPTSVGSLNLKQIGSTTLGRVKSGVNTVRRNILAITSPTQHQSYNQLVSFRSGLEQTHKFLNESLEIEPLQNIEIQSARCETNLRH